MGDVAALGIHVEHGVGAAVEIIALAEVLVSDRADARHDAHVEHNHDGVGHLHAHLGERRTRRAHEVGNHIQRAPLHAASQETLELGIHLLGSGPVIGGADFLLARRADKSELLNACDVVRVGASVVAARQLLLVELHEDSILHGEIVEVFFFRLGAIDPENLVGRGQFRRGTDEVEDGLIGGLCGAEFHMFFGFCAGDSGWREGRALCAFCPFLTASG